jgi:mono/diheme cytochrome c family protein
MKRVRLSSVFLTLAAIATGALAAAIAATYTGFYNVAATEQHLAPTYSILQIALRESIERHSRGIEVPPLGDAALIRRGLALHETHCVQCHGAPGVAPAPFALGLTPLPTNLSHAARVRTPAELYWVVRNGVKMTGMPAWLFRLDERDLWAVVAFMQQLPLMAPEDYAARTATMSSELHAHDARAPSAPPDPVRGKMALKQYACTTCHSIPGVVGDHAPVGPPLDRIGARDYLGGVLPNSRENMVRWLRAPQEVSPRSAMPDLGVTERDAVDMAEYLYTLR